MSEQHELRMARETYPEMPQRQLATVIKNAFIGYPNISQRTWATVYGMLRRFDAAQKAAKRSGRRQKVAA